MQAILGAGMWVQVAPKGCPKIETFQWNCLKARTTSKISIGVPYIRNWQCKQEDTFYITTSEYNELKCIIVIIYQTYYNPNQISMLSQITKMVTKCS